MGDIVTGTGWTTRQLIRAQREGAVIRAGTIEVTFRPRRGRDRTPWVSPSGAWRYRANECRPESASGGLWSVARLLRF